MCVLLQEGKKHTVYGTGIEQINCCFISAVFAFLQSLRERCLTSARVRAQKNCVSFWCAITFGDSRVLTRLVVMSMMVAVSFLKKKISSYLGQVS